MEISDEIGEKKNHIELSAIHKRIRIHTNHRISNVIKIKKKEYEKIVMDWSSYNTFFVLHFARRTTISRSAMVKISRTAARFSERRYL